MDAIADVLKTLIDGVVGIILVALSFAFVLSPFLLLVFLVWMASK